MKKRKGHVRVVNLRLVEIIFFELLCYTVVCIHKVWERLRGDNEGCECRGSRVLIDFKCQRGNFQLKKVEYEKTYR